MLLNTNALRLTIFAKRATTKTRSSDAITLQYKATPIQVKTYEFRTNLYEIL